MSSWKDNSRTSKRLVILAIIANLLSLSIVASGCYQATPEETVYKFLGAVQAHDTEAMRSCINPEALLKAEESKGEILRQWDELNRKYMVEPINWRMEFRGVTLNCSYMDKSSALVKLVGGNCVLYNLKEGKWVQEGEIDFSTKDFSPLYVV